MRSSVRRKQCLRCPSRTTIFLTCRRCGTTRAPPPIRPKGISPRLRLRRKRSQQSEAAPISPVLQPGASPPAISLSLLTNVVLGRIAQAQGDLATAIAEYEAAMQIERTLPYMEPPYWYYPVGQSL